MFGKPLDAVTKEDIDALVENGIRENERLDYKGALPGKDTKEFCKDVVAFANSGGGYLIYGIEDQRDAKGKATGVPAAVVGVPVDNEESEIGRLFQVLGNGISPRISRIRHHVVRGFSGGSVIVLEVGRSFAAPHMVTLAESSFFGRGAHARFEMTVDQIREAFIGTHAVRERAEAWLENRVNAARQRKLPVVVQSGPTILLHLYPLSAGVPFATEDFLAEGIQEQGKIGAFGSRHGEPRTNFDGLFFSGSSTGGKGLSGCTLFFRAGVLETVDTTCFERHYYCVDTSQSVPKLPAYRFEGGVRSWIEDNVRFLGRCGVRPPILFQLSLINVHTAVLGRDECYQEDGMPLDRGEVVFPPILIDEYEFQIDALLKPLFNAVWQSFGYSECHHYRNGKWSAH